eukprot:TRINITY_DN24627_c0_g1_i3.p1 TRINITY_DN24627_c0_g1~~TRINITY_DN24627_c0_g1_i3.p1  ORF type:complete len:259 (-),score=25.39 TRINITY_DN24627_c0_g1_i3:426-1142(-)
MSSDGRPLESSSLDENSARSALDNRVIQASSEIVLLDFAKDENPEGCSAGVNDRAVIDCCDSSSDLTDRWARWRDRRKQKKEQRASRKKPCYADLLKKESTQLRFESFRTLTSTSLARHCSECVGASTSEEEAPRLLDLKARLQTIESEDESLDNSPPRSYLSSVNLSFDEHFCLHDCASDAPTDDSSTDLSSMGGDTLQELIGVVEDTWTRDGFRTLLRNTSCEGIAQKGRWKTLSL